MGKLKKLTDSFSDESFILLLGQVRNEIEKEILLFIKEAKELLNSNQRIFANPESRIKSIDSFIEKVKRKDYLNKWDINEDIKINQNTICDKLPDLIGFRINCFFLNDEEIIYNIMKKYYEDRNFSDKVLIDFSENTKMKNGHNIFKVTGKYEGKYNFEIQIKSAFNNIWGEVEHKTVYKGNDYDPRIETKKVITEEIYNILSASDKQLVSIFSDKYKEKELLQSLFFQKTKDKITEKTKTSVLAKHYSNFFDIFSGSDNSDCIAKYVGSLLIGIEYNKVEINYTEKDLDVLELIDNIKESYYTFEFEVLYEIMSEIYEFKSYDDFIYYLLDYRMKYIRDDVGIEEETPFGDQIDEVVDNVKTTMIDYLNIYFSRKVE